MPLGEFEKQVSGFLSDHTYVTANVSTYGADGLEMSLTGLTWNLLNQCHPKNNPFTINETGVDYVARKIEQLEFLLLQIQSGTIDFINLQEVDIFTTRPMPEFVSKFLEKIRAQGWGAVCTESGDNARMPLYTFYNTNKLEFVSKKAVFPNDADKKNCALESTFKYKHSNNQICITNIHLDYETDFRAHILKYQKNQIVNQKLTIVAGDANHPPEIEYYSLIGDKVNRPTNIDPQGRLRLLDGFMVSPAVANQRVTIVEGPLVAFFKKVAPSLLSTFFSAEERASKQPKFTCAHYELAPNDRLPHGVHVSLPGEPWIFSKFKHLLLQIHPSKPEVTQDHP